MERGPCRALMVEGPTARTGLGAEDPDEALLVRVADGDPAAVRALVGRKLPRLLGLAQRMLGDGMEAEDVAQEAFLRVWRQAPKWRPGQARFDTWLYRLVVNICLDHRRRRRNLLPILEDLVDVVRPSRETVLGDMLQAEAHDKVREIVSRLAPEHRMVVVLRYTEGLSYEEIAEILGCSRGTVASRLNRAHKILARRLTKFRNTGGSCV